MDPDRIVLGGDRRAVPGRAGPRCTPASAASTAIRTNPRDGRDDQVRVERAAGDADLVLERDRQPVCDAAWASTSWTSCGACTLDKRISPIASPTAVA